MGIIGNMGGDITKIERRLIIFSANGSVQNDLLLYECPANTITKFRIQYAVWSGAGYCTATPKLKRLNSTFDFDLGYPTTQVNAGADNPYDVPPNAATLLTMQNLVPDTSEILLRESEKIVLDSVYTPFVSGSLQFWIFIEETTKA